MTEVKVKATLACPVCMHITKDPIVQLKFWDDVTFVQCEKCQYEHLLNEAEVEGHRKEAMLASTADKTAASVMAKVPLPSFCKSVKQEKDMDKQAQIQTLERAKELIDSVIESLDDTGGDDFPIPEEQLVWKNGNLWKPESDSNGFPVVLLREDWPQPDGVACELKDGGFDKLLYTGRSNGNRHTFRAPRGATAYAGRRKGGGVRVLYGGEWGIIPFPGPPKFRYD